MFGFLNPSVRDASDPVVSPKAAAAWLREMPSLDIVARQQLVARALEGMRQSRRPVDFTRAHALQYVDAALGADRRQLFKQYVESLESKPKVSERLWQASLDLAQGFIAAYQHVLETALAPSSFGRWKRTVSLVAETWLSLSTVVGIPIVRSLARGGTAVATGGAKLDTGAWPGAWPGVGGASCADSAVSQTIPAFIGKTSGIGLYVVRRPARHRKYDTVAATAAAITTTATTKITK